MDLLVTRPPTHPLAYADLLMDVKRVTNDATACTFSDHPRRLLNDSLPESLYSHLLQYRTHVHDLSFGLKLISSSFSVYLFFILHTYVYTYRVFRIKKDFIDILWILINSLIKILTVLKY